MKQMIARTLRSSSSSPSTLQIQKNFLATEQSPTTQKSGLFQLRKSTGYALSKCREAIQKFDGNVEQAEKWLEENAQKEGWAKTEKLKNRSMTQGVLALYADKDARKAVICEMNCETDFVAKNEKFIDLTSLVAMSVLKNFTTKHPKHLLTKDDLNTLGFMNEDSKTIGDQVALNIGSLGENMSVGRAMILSYESGTQLSWYMHGSLNEPKNGCHFGKYGAMVNFSMSKFNDNYKPFDLGRQVAQHIVGMRPSKMGKLPKEKEDPSKTIKLDDNETRLLYQEFLMKPKIRVLDFLNENHIVLNDYVRVQCGEQ